MSTLLYLYSCYYFIHHLMVVHMQSYNRRLYTSEALWKNLVYVLVFCLFAWWQMSDVFVDDAQDTEISGEE